VVSGLMQADRAGNVKNDNKPTGRDYLAAG
jgi:hypothetical protein